MEVILKSDWQKIQVELLKNLHGYEYKDLNGETGYVDYVAENKDDERKLLRVIVGPMLHASKASVSTVEDTLKKLEDDEYDEVTLMANSFTTASKRLVEENDDLEMISPEESFHSTTKIYGAIQGLTASLCEKKCGRLPKTKEDCKGVINGENRFAREYRCSVRRVSDDADFHAKMSWLAILMSDFSKLIELKREMDQ